MPKRLNPKILEFLSGKLGKTPEQIRPRLSEIRRKYSALTPNAAAQVYAQQQGTSIMAKLDEEDRRSLSIVQNISHTEVNSTKNIKIDRRTLNVNNSPIHNLSFGDRNTVNQSVVNLDKVLSELFEKVNTSNKLSADEKSDYKSDIESLASQIGKVKPNHTIIKAAWKSIQALSDIQGFTSLIVQLTPLIEGILHGSGMT